ncbi:hypothetical protein [Streptomyces sp. AC602_WCS936]|uniref:hypothetical protein n=1 Tax=Streptomyces sp. AC602_WCS936 TaxID=2823685 RepID=UPI001C273DCE|nr:hypothetical protein [Streptomyces sp. AC602_WCS936]
MGLRAWSTGRRQSPRGEEPKPGTNADLDLLHDQVRQLRELADNPEQATDADRVYDFGIRWGAFLHGRLPRLTALDRRGMLTPAEQCRFADLRAELRDVEPLAKGLGLVVPPSDGERPR